MLAVLAEAVVAVTIVLAVGRRWSPRLRAWATSLRSGVGPYALWFAFAVAAVSMAGSLWFSERAHFPPCTLCWYQRIAMYPLVPILGIAALRRDLAVRWYVLPLAVIGGAISTYHVVLERYPSLESGACDPSNPCSIIWVERFGYLTIPAMALSAFALIAALLLLARDESEV